MDPDSPPATDTIAGLLLRAKDAHGVYEATELKGEYDADWPRWYAEWTIEHGLAELAGRPAPLDRVAQLLETGYAEYERSDVKESEDWASYVGRRLSEEL